MLEFDGLDAELCRTLLAQMFELAGTPAAMPGGSAIDVFPHVLAHRSRRFHRVSQRDRGLSFGIHRARPRPGSIQRVPGTSSSRHIIIAPGAVPLLVHDMSSLAALDPSGPQA
jgi:hypothetical protein